MNNYHGKGRSSNYFEGWYVRLVGDDGVLAFIPGISMGENGKKQAFVQVLSSEKSSFVPYPVTSFSCALYDPAVKVEESLFTEKGVSVSIHTKSLDCEGLVRYGPLTPLQYDIMGPFCLLPLMQCHHQVISMRHSLSGSIKINGRLMCFDGGVGYIEKDWGSSFPNSYLWLQSNQFDSPHFCSVMASVAEVPFCGFSFLGCICAVRYGNTEYRLATYNGARVLRWDERGLMIKQGGLLFIADVKGSSANTLKAPVLGSMSRIIRENACCTVRLRLFVGNIQLFDLTGKQAGFEYVPTQKTVKTILSAY